MTTKPMKPKELKAIIEGWEETQNGLARFLELSDGRTLRRWLEDTDSEGHRDIPPTAAKFLRYMIAAGLTPADVDAALAKAEARAKR